MFFFDPAPNFPTGDTNLTSEEIEALQEERLLVPSATESKRKVSVALLSSRMSAASSLSSSSSPSVTVSYRSSNVDLNQTFFLPASEDSHGALEFIGFTAEASTVILNNFSQKPASSSDGLFDYAVAHIGCLERQEVEDMGAKKALESVGISTDLIKVITDPKHAQICDTESLHYWVKDTITVNWRTMLKLQIRLKTLARAAVTKKTEEQK
ncbi:hypothetical protein GMOD_00008470 [Pyrenophora seminiperda CCB06]|uniref:Uncharacterized protein n=1 Tax=Pyrenophora seminiperda CCB06 TaxID=1302712 RepID=A0A3M7M8I1_9PLEO|nr:hypothetical protein GMOD_00008470 [Pyrenophora seminiperda CCB06]